MSGGANFPVPSVAVAADTQPVSERGKWRFRRKRTEDDYDDGEDEGIAEKCMQIRVERRIVFCCKNYRKYSLETN